MFTGLSSPLPLARELLTWFPPSLCGQLKNNSILLLHDAVTSMLYLSICGGFNEPVAALAHLSSQLIILEYQVPKYLRL